MFQHKKNENDLSYVNISLHNRTADIVDRAGGSSSPSDIIDLEKKEPYPNNYFIDIYNHGEGSTRHAYECDESLLADDAYADGEEKYPFNDSDSPLISYHNDSESYYEVEISTVSMPSVILPNEEAPYVIAIRNNSDEIIGYGAENSLPVRLELMQDEMDASEPLDVYDENNQHQSLKKPLIYYVEYLKPNHTILLKGTFKFQGDVPFYSVAHLTWSLYLDHDEPVQTRNKRLQLSEAFQYDPEAELVLAVHNGIGPETIQLWKDFAAKIGTSISVWNISLYGFSYTQTRCDGGSFFDQMTDKVIVILNDGMEESTPIAYLDAMEIFNAAQFNVTTYIIGNDFDFRSLISPLFDRDTDPVKIISKFYLTRPSENDLLPEVNKWLKYLKRVNPLNRYLPVYNFMLSRKDGWKWELGSVTFRKALDHLRCRIAFHKNGDCHVLQPADAYAIIRLLPFRRKLRFLEETNDEESTVLIQQAILSDLTYELLVSENHCELSHLKTLSEYPFSNIRHLSDILLKYEYFCSRLPREQYGLFCESGQKKIAKEIIKKLLSEKFPEEQFIGNRKKIKKEWRACLLKELYIRFALSYHPDILFDNRMLLNPVPKSHFTYTLKESHFKKNPSCFFKNDEERRKGIESWESECQFRP